MNNQFNEQKEYLTSLKHEISLLQQQVDYLIRNEKAIGLLDLDVLMNRTHTIYDQLCSINVGASAADDEDIDIDPKMLSALFGNEEETESEELGVRSEEDLSRRDYPSVEREETESEELGVRSEEDLSRRDDLSVEKNEEEEFEERSEPEEEILPEKEPLVEEVPLEEETQSVPEIPSKEETQPVEDYGFIFKMEPLDAEPENEEEQPAPEIDNPADEETVEEEPVEEIAVNEDGSKETTGFIDFGEEIPEKKNNIYTTGDEIEMVIPHFDFPTIDDNPEEEVPEEEIPEEEIPEEEVPEEEILEDEIIEEEIPEEETTEELIPEEEPEEDAVVEEAPIERIPEEETAEETKTDDDFAYEPIIFGNMMENEEVGFEIETQETLGDRMQHGEDHSLAAKLQHQSVRSLRSAIGINDKFLLVNELFSGSMEKYNRSIENLDDVKTLNGALIYLNELRIELQWNSNNEAYKKLLDLIHYKFES